MSSVFLWGSIFFPERLVTYWVILICLILYNDAKYGVYSLEGCRY